MTILRRAFPVLALLASPLAHASFLSGEALDTAADWVSWFVIFFVPALAIGGFLFVHVLPEKIAEKRHHPQKDSIKVLCILSLFFGGMLWPLAWLWAYTKPVGYRLAYGTDKHDDYYHDMADKHRAGKLLREDLHHLHEDLKAMESRGALPPKLRALKEEIETIGEAPVPSAHDKGNA